MVSVYTTAEIMETPEILENRDGKLIIEKCIGKCLDNAGNGEIIGIESEYNYISYSEVENVQTGDIICSYFIYDTDCNYIDCITDRYDYVIDSVK